MKDCFALLALFCWSNVGAIAAEPVRVSTFSTVLTEIAQKVGGDRVIVHAHVRPGVDPHEFEPKPADLKIITESQLILLSAKHIEGYVGKLREATGTNGTVLEVGDQFPSLKLQADDHEHARTKGEKGHDEAIED